MIQLKTMLNCIDNSGATLVECVATLGMKRHARVGDRIIVVVQRHRPNAGEGPGAGAAGGLGAGGGKGTGAAAGTKVRRGDMRHAVVVRAAYARPRRDGMCVGFDDNACVLITKAGEPIGSRVSRAELRDKQWSKILSLAPAHV